MLVSGRDEKISRREKRAFLATAYDWCDRTKNNLIFLDVLTFTGFLT
jgi:hypothetical protein